MKKTDDVFFFTLIDFLIQVFFFGLVLFVLNELINEKVKEEQANDQAKIETLLKKTGVSTLTELTDQLSKLAPITELKGISDFLNRAGGLEKVKTDVATVANAGGTSVVQDKLEKLKRIEEGSGKPPCLFDKLPDGKKSVKPLATVEATDTSIKFTGQTPELEKLLSRMGATYESIEELTFSQFKSAFSPVIKLDPDCRYTLRFIERTDYIYARDAVRQYFYFNPQRVKQ